MGVRIQPNMSVTDIQRVRIVLKELIDTPALAETPYVYDNLRDGFAGLFANYSRRIDKDKDNELYNVLQDINIVLGKDRIDVAVAAAALDHLARAINKADPDYLRPTPGGKYDDFNGNIKRYPWEAQAAELSVKVVERVSRRFMQNEISAEAALELGLKARPFMTYSAESLTRWEADIGPTVNGVLEKEQAALKDSARNPAKS